MKNKSEKTKIIKAWAVVKRNHIMVDCYWPNWKTGKRAFYIISPNKKSAEHFLYRFGDMDDLLRYKVIPIKIIL